MFYAFSFIIKYFVLLEMVGYNGNFLIPLAEHHKCPCCSYAFRDPMQTECGHRICKECYGDLQQKWYNMETTLDVLIPYLEMVGYKGSFPFCLLNIINAYVVLWTLTCIANRMWP